MSFITGRSTLAALCGALLLLLTNAGAGAQSDMSSLTARLPKSVNAVMTIDVAKLVSSPVGKANDVQSRLASTQADRMLMIPATARKVALGAVVHPTGLRSIYRVALIDLPHPPRLEPILRAQKGYLDKIDGHNVAWSPRDVFYVELDSNTMGVFAPAQRQYFINWLTAKPAAEGLSPALAAALTNAGSADAVFALDLHSAVSLPALRYAMAMGQLASLEQLEATEDAVVRALATVKSMSVAMRFTDSVEAEWVIDFEQSIAGLGNQVKPFLAEVMTLADLHSPDFDAWEFKVDGKRIVGRRKLELANFAQLIGMLSPHGMTDDGASEPAAAPAAGAAQPAPSAGAAAANPVAVASQKYYRAIAKSLDGMSMKTSPTQGASWLLAQARMIEQLPVLNVDPELLEWGSDVMEAYKRAAAELSLGQQRAISAAEGVASPVGYTTDSPNGGSVTDTADSRAAYRNAQQQRRQAAQSARADAAQRAMTVFSEVSAERQKVRVDMTQKYGIEF